MKAIIYTEYGPPEVLTVKDIEKPVPKSTEIIVKIHAVSVNFGDLLVRKFHTVTAQTFTMPLPLLLPTRLVFGAKKPKKTILGSEFSGIVADVGSAVTQFQKGDAVFGYRAQNLGAYVEYLSIPEKSLVARKPENMSFEEAATVPYGALTALNLLRKLQIQPGQKVLINGASGAIGSYAVQLALSYGAEITGVAGTPRLDFVRSLGTTHVVDYTQEDFTQNGQTYDCIIDVLGKSSFEACKNSLTPQGIYLPVSFKTGQLIQMFMTRLMGGKKIICALSNESIDDLVLIKELCEKGTIKTIIDKTFPLEKAADAHKYSEGGQKKGHIVLTV